MVFEQKAQNNFIFVSFVEIISKCLCFFVKFCTAGSTKFTLKRHLQLLLYKLHFVVTASIREFKKLLQLRQGLHRLKSEFIFYLLISQYS